MINKDEVASLEEVLSMLPFRIKKIYQTECLPKISIIRNYTYPYSHICLVEFNKENNETTRLFIKRIILNNKSKAIIQKAIEAEEDLLKQLESSKLSGIVRLIDVFPEQLCLVTEECQGEQLNHFISSTRFWWWQGELQHEISSLCGLWLKLFHETTANKSGSMYSWYEYLSGEMIWRIRLLSERLPEYEVLFKRCQKRFDVDVYKLDRQGLIYDYHGDFAPHNIFFQQKTIQVIDFYGTRKGHGLMDVINFISSVATHSESFLYPKQLITKFCQNFFDAYGQINSPDPRLPALILVLQAIKRLTVLATANNSKKSLSQVCNSKKWYLDYIDLYLDDNIFLNKTTCGPWPFMDLSDYLSCSSQ